MPRNHIRVLGTRLYANYTIETLEACMEAIRTKKMTQRKAAQHYNIPRSTIKSKLKNGHGKKAGRPTIFTFEEETSFAQHCMKLADFGFPMDYSDLKMTIARYLKEKGTVVPIFKENTPGQDWVYGFLKRHPNLTLKSCSNIKKSRAKVTEDDITEYIDRLTVTLDGIPPSRIYNYDETNLTDDPGTKRVIAKRGSKYIEKICNFSKSAISLMFCGNAEGLMLPVYVVYKAESLWTTWTEGGPPNTRYNRTRSGWFDSDTFEDWFCTVFLPAVKGGGPSALIGDNLSSHINERVLKLCEENEIKFVCLPPNTTHISQPLDVAYFRALKGAWREILTNWKKTKTGSNFTTLPKDLFPRLLKTLLDKLQVKEQKNLQSGFRRAGIHPINKNKLLERLAERKGSELDKDLIGQAFLNSIQKERDDFVGITGQERRKKLRVPAGQSISTQELEKLRREEEEKKAAAKAAAAEAKKSKLNAKKSQQNAKKRKRPSTPVSSSSSDESVDLESDNETESFGSFEAGDSDLDEDDPSDYDVNDFILVNFQGTKYPGKIDKISKEGPVVDCLEKVGKAWRWPLRQDCVQYLWKEVICKINPPKLQKRNLFSVPELNDFV